MLANVARPCSTAATIVAKSSSRSTRSAASRATSVPLRPMATPMSASLQGRAVVDAVAGHRDDVAAACSARAMRSLSSGATRADHDRRRGRACAPSTASSAGRSVPSRTSLLGAERGRPRAAMARAVAGWSPVIMATRMPARPARGERVGGLRREAGPRSPSRPRSSRSRSTSSAVASASAVRQLAPGHRQDPQAPAGQPVDASHRGAGDRTAAGQDRVGSALHEQASCRTTHGHRVAVAGRRGTGAVGRGAVVVGDVDAAAASDVRSRPPSGRPRAIHDPSVVRRPGPSSTPGRSSRSHRAALDGRGRSRQRCRAGA